MVANWGPSIRNLISYLSPPVIKTKMFRINTVTRTIRGFHSTASKLHDAAVLGLHADGQLLVPNSIAATGKENLSNLIKAAGAKGKSGESRVFYGDFGLGSDIQKVAVVGLGQQGTSAAAKDRIRMAVGPTNIPFHTISTLFVLFIQPTKNCF
jgi:hypothetical protein